MKRILFSFLFLMLPFLSEGQTDHKNLMYIATVGTGIPMSSPSTIPFSLRGSVLYSLGNRLAAGVGTGFSLCNKEALIPIFGDVRFNIMRPARFTPYLDCQVGYSFAPAKAVNGGFYLSPSIGLQMGLPCSHQLLFAVGYEVQKLARLKEYDTPHFISAYEETLNDQAVSIKLGFVF